MSSLETAMMKARSAEKRGDFAEAEQLYGAVLQKFPGNARARKGMDALFKARALAVMQADAPPQAALDALADAYGQGRMEQVVDQAEALLQGHPRSAIVINLLGAALLTLGRPDRAETALRAALDRGIRHPALCNNLGMALAGLGRPSEAAQAYREALALDPNYAIGHNNLGNALKEAGRLDEALAAYDAALALQDDYADACNNRALALDALGRADEAQEGYLRVLALNPAHAAARNNLANLLVDSGDLTAALEQYQQAVQLAPNYAEAHFNLGNLYKRQGRLDLARESFAQAMAVRPGYADAATEQGKALALDGRFDAALGALDAALAAEPGHQSALLHRLYYRTMVCDWSAFADFDVASAGSDGAISPFTTLTFADDPAAQLRRSRAWADRVFPKRSTPCPQPAPAADGRIRIGYFSADFHDHATTYLMAGLLREHDRSRFAIHAFSYGPPRDDAMRRQIVALTESFTDVRERPHADVVALARARQIDIAVDLKGYTQDGRLRLFAERLAPVQIGYLGYPGSSGAEFIDYLVADTVVIPATERAHYSENLILLPGSYQPTDDARVIAPRAGTRADHGLPDRGFVFCSFNQSYKVTPREWAIWMRLLAQVDGSVLWLFRSNAWAEANLRAQAAAHGIDPARLVFAARIPQAEHLARHVHADLFLDSFAVNAHTTASDALWAGLPVVTMAGRQFAARVAASLLHAVGLPELVTDTPAAYEALILALATRPERLAEVRARLAANRSTQPLFDTAGYARRFEAGLEAAHRRHLAGEAPGDIAIG